MTNNPEATDYPEAVWYTPSDNSSRKYIRDDLCKAALASSAPATGEREQIVGWLRGKPKEPFTYTADYIAEQIERGDHRTQSGDMEGGEHG